MLIRLRSVIKPTIKLLQELAPIAQGLAAAAPLGFWLKKEWDSVSSFFSFPFRRSKPMQVIRVDRKGNRFLMNLKDGSWTPVDTDA